MNDLIAQLLELTGQLEPAAGVVQESLSALRRLIAAILIQQNPGFLPVVVPADEDAAIAEAALAGETLAAERTASGIRSRFVRQPYLDQTSDIELPAEVFGPFIDATGRLVQFRVFDVASFLPVTVPDQIQSFDHELPMLLPPQTTGDAGLRNFTIPAGTVWVRGERVLHGATGYAVLRVSGGSLELDAPAAQASRARRSNSRSILSGASH